MSTTSFGHQVRDLYASQKVRVFPSFQKVETFSWHERGYTWADAVKCSIENIQLSFSADNLVKYQKNSQHFKYTWKIENLVSPKNQRKISSLLAKKK